MIQTGGGQEEEHQGSRHIGMPWARAGLILCSHQPPEICATPGASSSSSWQVQARPLILVGWMEPAQMELINLSSPWQETDREQLADSLVLH